MSQLRRKVDALDLTGVSLKLGDQGGKYAWENGRIDSALQGYREFLCSANDDPLTQDVDEAWHLHILDTQKYAQDCQDLFGGFLHHIPSYAPAQDGAVTCGQCRSGRVTCGKALATCGRRLAVTCGRMLAALNAAGTSLMGALVR